MSTQVLEVGSKEANEAIEAAAKELNVGTGLKGKVKPQGKTEPTAETTKPLPPVPTVKTVTPEQQAIIDERNADLAKLEAARTDASHAVGSFETSTAIGIYSAIGEKCWDAVYLQYMMHGKECEGRKVPNSWKEADYDNGVGIIRTRCETHYPHLFLSSTDGRKDGVVAKVANYILAYLAVKVLLGSFGHLTDAINGLSYHAIVNLIGRKCVTFSKVAMDCTLNPQWVEFLKTNIQRLYVGSLDKNDPNGISYKDFVALVTEHEHKLTNAKAAESVAGKTPAQLAQEAKEAEMKKKAQVASGKESKVRTDLSTSLSVALAGGLKPEAISAIIEKSCTDAKVPVSALVPATPAFDAKTVTYKQMVDVVTAIGMAGRFDEIKKLHKLLATMVMAIDASDKATSEAA